MDRGRQKAVPAVSVERRIQFNTASDVVAMEEDPIRRIRRTRKRRKRRRNTSIRIRKRRNVVFV